MLSIVRLSIFGAFLGLIQSVPAFAAASAAAATSGAAVNPSYIGIGWEFTRSVESGYAATLTSAKQPLLNGRTGWVQITCRSRVEPAPQTDFLQKLDLLQTQTAASPVITISAIIRTLNDSSQDSAIYDENNKSAIGADISVDGQYVFTDFATIENKGLYGNVFTVAIGGAAVDNARRIFGSMNSTITLTLGLKGVGKVADLKAYDYTFAFKVNNADDRAAMDAFYAVWAQSCYEGE